MIQVVQEEGVVCLTFGCNAVTITGICFLVLRVPALRIRRVGNHCIQIERIISLGCIVVHRPVLLKGIAATGKDIVGLDTTHDKVHTSEVVCVLLQLLRIILNVVLAFHVLGHAFTNGNQQ